MPTYEYACKSCAQHLEVVQSFSDDALTTCPACGGSLRKVFGNIGISFKGTGFYKNDSRSSTRGGTASTSGDSGSSSGTSASGDSGSSESGGPAKDASSPKDGSSTKETPAPAKEATKDTGRAAPVKPAAAAS